MKATGRFAIMLTLLGSVVGSTAFLSGCDSLFGVDCTLIGCDDELEVAVAGHVPDSFLVVVRASDTGEEVSMHCDGACSGTFPQFAPATVIIEIEWDGGTISETRQPDYDVHQPNGPRCGPECSVGTLLVEMAPPG